MALRRALAKRSRRPRSFSSPVTSSARLVGCRAATHTCSCPKLHGPRSCRSDASRPAHRPGCWRWVEGHPPFWRSSRTSSETATPRCPRGRRRPGVDLDGRRARSLSRACPRIASGTGGRPARDEGNPVGSGIPRPTPRSSLAGVYEGLGPTSELAQAPIWLRLSRQRRLRSASTATRHADRSSPRGRPGRRAFASRRSRGLRPRSCAQADRVSCCHVGADGRSDVRFAQRCLDRRRGGSFERIASYDVDPNTAAAALAAADDARFERLLDEHRRTWAQRWDEADVGDRRRRELQRAVRFALFHLMGSVGDSGEAAVGARGLSGAGYRGHVFWDSDVFVLPFLAATHPAGSARDARVPRAATSGRARRGTQRSAARARGSPGSPPRTAATSRRPRPPAQRARVVPIRTGELEEHIVADVAWAASLLSRLDGRRGIRCRRRAPS